LVGRHKTWRQKKYGSLYIHLRLRISRCIALFSVGEIPCDDQSEEKDENPQPYEGIRSGMVFE
jgi:hypothetical protein